MKRRLICSFPSFPINADVARKHKSKLITYVRVFERTSWKRETLAHIHCVQSPGSSAACTGHTSPLARHIARWLSRVASMVL